MHQRALIVVLLCLEILTALSFSCNNRHKRQYRHFQSTSFGLKPRKGYLHSSMLFYKNFRGDDDDAQFLPLNDSDIRKIRDMKERHITIPIIILDAILPGQCMNFKSTDPKFGKLLEHVLQQSSGEIGIIGFNPYTGKPLNMGSTVRVSKSDIVTDSFDPNLLAISVQAKRRFEVQGEPELDKTNSFYLADVEIIDHKVQDISKEEKLKANKISMTIPELVEEWTEWLMKSGKMDSLGIEKIMKTIGPLPEKVCDRAIWVVSLLTPLPSLKVCPDVRPALLACKNDYERMILAATAIQSSIDHLSGKRKIV